MILGLVGFAFFNKAANDIVSHFGYMIRSAYDLFRLQLLEQMGIEKPKDSYEEFYLWKNIGELLVLGQLSMEFEYLEYQKPKKKKGKKKKKKMDNNKNRSQKNT